VEFEEVTGLALTDADGTLREELPPIIIFLNRLLALTIDLQNTLSAVFEQLLTARIEDAVAAVSYDAGVETLTAESLRVIDRRTVYTHQATGAETQVFIVERHDRNKPLALADALEQASDPSTALLVNTQSGRAAVRLRAPSVMRDDGEVERRVRLLRPMERMSVSVDALAQPHWREADHDAFAAAWQAEVACIDELSVTRFHMVTGLLLPIWRRLPDGSCKVYRLQTDDGERVIGRLVPATWIVQVVDAAMPPLSPDEAWCALLGDDVRLDLVEGMQLQRVTVMSAVRVELTGFTDGMVERLKAIGLISEIIAWRLRLFVPTGSQGPTVLAALPERYPLTRISERAAA
jgi:hypothetical protein